MRKLFWCVAGVALTTMFGCGGGGSGSSPAPQVTLPGAGAAVSFNQKITFVLNVPAATASTSAKNKRSALGSTTPYVSPKTGSVQLILAEVNGVSPQQAPPAIPSINVPQSCQGSAAGCTIPVNNVPAALGVNRYFVQTYAGTNSTGALISTGFVDVSVPSSAKTGIGGPAAALSIGGYVANIVLAPVSVNVVAGTASDQSILVQALDAAGATVVGAAQYVTPITVSLSLDTKNFSLNGGTSVSVTGPLPKPLDLHYGGGSSPFGSEVDATSLGSSGATVTAVPIAVNVLAPGSSPTPTAPVTPVSTSIPTGIPTGAPTPPPRPTPTPVTNALSLYVADGQSDTVSEYRFGTQIANGNFPNPAATPDRVVQFNPTQLPPAIAGRIACTPALQSSSATGNGTAGVAVAPDGTLYLFPDCFDLQPDANYVLGYPPNAVGSPAPSILDPIPLNFTGVGAPLGLAFTSGTIYAADQANGLFITGWPESSNGKQPTVNLGLLCFAEFGLSGGCSSYFSSFETSFALDGNGFAYVPAYWNDQPPAANGVDAAALVQPAALLAIPATGQAQQVTPFSAIAGINSTIGGSSAVPIAATVDGTTIYVLTGSSVLQPITGNNLYFPGVSSCPPPSANAPINSLVPVGSQGQTGPTQCVDQQQHFYLTAYQISDQLLGAGARHQNVDLSPYFIMGGDITGGFGCLDNNGGSSGGQYLAASAGYVYVINLATSCNADGTPNIAPEIDVYDTNNVIGVHTDIAPVFKLPLPNGLPLAITLGPSGTAVGGQALLHVRRPAYHQAQHRAEESRYPPRRIFRRPSFHR